VVDCTFFQSRIGTDPSIDSGFVARLRSPCAGQSFTFINGAMPAGFNNYKNVQADRLSAFIRFSVN
jgi:peroxidase